MKELDIEEIRRNIPALRESIFLNTAGIGPPPKVVTDALLATFTALGDKGRYYPPLLREMYARGEEARQRIAALFGVEPEEITFCRCISGGINIVASGLSWQPGDEILISDQEHPSGYLPWIRLVPKHGVVVKKLRLANDKELLLSRLEEMITPHTKLFSLSHATNKSGIRLPAKEIDQMAHQRGILVLYDGAQSAGQFPVNLREIDCDFYAATSYKWLLGPYGVGVFYTKRELLPQVEATWLGSRSTKRLDFERDEYDLWDTARRYEFGARSIPLRIAFGKAVEFIAKVGPARIEERVTGLASYFRERLLEIPGVRINSPMDRELATGIVSVAWEAMEPRKAADELWERWKIITVPTEGKDPKLRGLRFSVAFFNTKEELDTTLQGIRHLPKERP